MLQESMKKEISCVKGSYSFLDLFRTPTMRKMTIYLSAVWYALKKEKTCYAPSMTL